MGEQNKGIKRKKDRVPFHIQTQIVFQVVLLAKTHWHRPKEKESKRRRHPLLTQSQAGKKAKRRGKIKTHH